MHPWAASVTGIIAGFSYLVWSGLVVFMKIDDPLDAAAVHAGGGSWGVLAIVFFHREKGIFYNLNSDISEALEVFFCFFSFQTLELLSLKFVDVLSEDGFHSRLRCRACVLCRNVFFVSGCDFSPSRSCHGKTLVFPKNVSCRTLSRRKGKERPI